MSEAKDDGLDQEIENREAEGYEGERWQRAIAWLRELRDLRAARTAGAERVREVVQEAIAATMNHCGHGGFVLPSEAIAIADRVVSELGPAGLSAKDRTILRRLRANESGARSSIGHLGEDVRRQCDEAIALLDRLLTGAAP